MGPLALMAKQAGNDVFGSDLAAGAILPELEAAGIEVEIGAQDGAFLSEKIAEGVDWFVYTSALPDDHAELVLARESGIRVSKRDEFTAYLVKELGLKMIAVSGTHGKTTTTAMIIWASLKLGLPVSYIVGTTLGFAPSGAYHPGDKYFVYEADEYDRNFLHYNPWLAILSSVTYDHPDIYPTREDYTAAFSQFKSQSENVIEGDEVVAEDFALAGEVRRKDATLASMAVKRMLEDLGQDDAADLKRILGEFPGVGRRFEKLKDGLYSDYAHHPEEIAATIEVAREEAELRGKKGVVVIYEPHQNKRQHEVREGYPEAFRGADKVYWLPTYLVRDNGDLPILSAEELSQGIENAEVAEMSDALAEKIRAELDEGMLVILMTAGPADEWVRKKI